MIAKRIAGTDAKNDFASQARNERRDDAAQTAGRMYNSLN